MYIIWIEVKYLSAGVKCDKDEIMNEQITLKRKNTANISSCSGYLVSVYIA